MRQPLLAFLTDYGVRDGFPAVCHGVMVGIAPDVRIIDVSHEIPAQDVRHGAIVLTRAARFLPPAVYVGVVDPGVGTARRGLALRAGASLLVGPDNGLLIPAAEALGGIDEAYDLTNPDWQLATVDRTFHGRDIFAPVGARLVRGDVLSQVGNPLQVDDLVRLPVEQSSFDPSTRTWTAEVRYVDGFGNVQLAPQPEGFAPSGEVEISSEENHLLGKAKAGSTFGDVGQGDLLFYVDADGRPAIAVNNGRAADRLGVRGGDVLRLRHP